MVISYPGYWLGQVSSFGNLAVSPLSVELADRCAAELRDHGNPYTHYCRAMYYDHVPRDRELAEEAWEKAVTNSTGDLWRTIYTSFLLEHYGIERALAEFEKAGKNRSLFSMSFEARLLALDSPERKQRAAAMWEQIGKKDREERPVVISVPAILGDRIGIRRVAGNWRQDGVNWLVPRLEYLTGEVTEEDFVSDYRASSLLLVAMEAIGANDREKAMRYLEQVEDQWPLVHYEALWAKGILAEMRRRPDWPVMPVSN